MPSGCYWVDRQIDIFENNFFFLLLAFCMLVFMCKLLMPCYGKDNFLHFSLKSGSKMQARF